MERHQSAKDHRHKFGEAFMLMWYACKCGHIERIWNSRDGVTPFCLGCPSCGEVSLNHTQWYRDVYTPDHQLHQEQRYFRDGTPDEAEEIMRGRIALMQDQYPTTSEEEEDMIRKTRSGKGEFQEGWPTVRRATIV